MHPKLISYYKRFQKSEQTQYTEFFTQYSLDNYKAKLPYLFAIENFCLRLYQALILNQEICIYSDYDTDAVTATATMFWGLVELGFNKSKIDFYAPDRFIEGYGMNTEAIQELSQKFDLIISVDCGINSTLEAEIVKNSKKCDLLITDHHHLSGQIPSALAVINPRLSDFYIKENKETGVLATEIATQKKLLLYDLASKCKEYNNLKNLTKIENWIKQMQDLKPVEYLTKSATGVAVAWFSLVWLGYFLSEIE
jgi:hypothetical protein